MGASAVLEDGNGLAKPALGFEIPNQYDRVSYVRNVQAGRHGTEQTMLRVDQKRNHTQLTQIRQ